MRLVAKFCSELSLKSAPLAAHVRRHVTSLLDSTAKYSSFEQQFGLTCEIGTRPSPELIARLSEDIKLQVSRWESRLLLDEVLYVERENQGFIQLIGKVAEQHCKIEFVVK
ncbi:MAG: hypothetical protein RPU52_15800 [Candidatus Sedimenticola sp. (ex Thyasira tokunagai)]